MAGLISCVEKTAKQVQAIAFVAIQWENERVWSTDGLLEVEDARVCKARWTNLGNASLEAEALMVQGLTPYSPNQITHPGPIACFVLAIFVSIFMQNS